MKSIFSLLGILIVIGLISFFAFGRGSSSQDVGYIENLLNTQNESLVVTNITALTALGTEAELYALEFGNYSGFCQSTSFQRIAHNTGQAGAVTCHASTGGWSVRAPMPKQPGTFYCLNSSGYKGPCQN